MSTALVVLASAVKQAISANIQTRLALTPAPIGLTQPALAHEAADRLFGWVYKQPGMATKAHCKHTLDQVAERFGTGESRYLLQRFGASRLDELWLAHCAGLVELGQATLAYGIPPSASWNNDNTPTMAADEL